MLCSTPLSLECLHSCAREPSTRLSARDAIHLRPISSSPSVLLLHLSTGTKKQRPGRVDGGSNNLVASAPRGANQEASNQIASNQIASNQVAGNPELPPVQPVEHMPAPNQQGGSELRKTEHTCATHQHLRQTSRSCTAGAACRPHTHRARCCGSIRQAAELRVGAHAGVSLRGAKSIHACVPIKRKAS